MRVLRAFACVVLLACGGAGSQSAGPIGASGSGVIAGEPAPMPASGASGAVAGNAAGSGGAGRAGGTAGVSGAGGPAAGGGGGAAAEGGGPEAGGGGTAAGGAASVAGGAAAGSGGAMAGGGGTSGAAAAGSGGDPASAAPKPDPKYLVPASGPCPEFRDGYAMFMPDGVARRVLLYAAPQAGKSGPLIISWHSTLPNPEDAVSWIGRNVIDEIKAQGGVVAAPTTADPRTTRPWDNTPMGPRNTDGDQRLMDEIVACAVSKVGVDVRRIHATGMSAGGLKTAQVSLRRSGYLASVVVYSGGFPTNEVPPDQEPQSPVAAMIFYGGRTDISPVDGIDYTAASNRYLEAMKARGSFAFSCDHGGGHSVPRDSQASAWRFMQDHPFGTKDSPYAASLPTEFPRYCNLN